MCVCVYMCVCVCVCVCVCIHAKLLQSYLTLCDPMDCSPPGSPVHGDSLGTVGCCALLQGIFLTQGMNICLLHWPGGFFTTGTTWEAMCVYMYIFHIFFICSSIDGHLGCFYTLTNVNSAVMSIAVHVSF